MLQVFYCFAIACLLVANSIGLHDRFLATVDFLVALYFLFIGCVAAWIHARQ